MIDITALKAIALRDVMPTKRQSYQDGFNLALLKRVDTNRELLKLEFDSDEEVDLDDHNVWKQKKVKEKAVQLLSILNGKNIEGKIIRHGIHFLKQHGQIKKVEFQKFLVENGYSEKTAIAQASQMFLLFKLLKVINSEGFINSRSLIWSKCLQLNS